LNQVRYNSAPSRSDGKLQDLFHCLHDSVQGLMAKLDLWIRRKTALLQTQAKEERNINSETVNEPWNIRERISADRFIREGLVATITNTSGIHRALNNEWFKNQGLINLDVGQTV
jgi:hypothetical protein